ncbi:MAG: DNA repair protein RadC [Ruthenibacterium sp.]
MGEHDNHRKRVYARFLREGLADFEEHNALEFLLFLARARGDTNLLAHQLIERFGSIAAVLDASEEELREVKGIGETAAVTLKFIPEMCAYYLDSKVNKKQPLNSIEAVGAFFMPKFFGKTREAFFVAALDDRRRLLRCLCISDGMANSTSVSTAKIVATAVRCHATGVILAHNHPQGITLPSSNDIACTKAVYKALNTVNIELLDHFIFADNEYLSFAQTNYMQSIHDSIQR